MLNKILQLILALSIGVASIIGDIFVQNARNSWLRAATDNLTHGLVAGISWALIVVQANESISRNIYYIILCSIMSSMIDLDHFLQARSWRLSDAIRLEKRPVLHCTTLPILIWLFLLLPARLLRWPKCETYSWIILISFLSHHIRDGNRRGLWFAFIGSTRPIPYYLYLVTDMMLPYAVFFAMNHNRREFMAYQGSVNIV